MSEYLSNEERTASYHEQFNRENTLRLLLTEPRPVVFDVGANVGATLEEFKQWWPDAQVHCFEPQEECWGELERRAAQYSDGQVIINQYAVGSVKTDSAVFYTHDISSGVSGFHEINLESNDSITLRKVRGLEGEGVAQYEQRLNRERSVTVARLDDYMQTGGIERINLLKIDTQGFEPEILEGLGDRLANVDIVLSELMFFDYYKRSLSFSDIEQWLLPAGLRLYDISHISKNPMNGRTDWVDVIYVNDRIRHGK
jgi:FkbM family methyltransferase